MCHWLLIFSKVCGEPKQAVVPTIGSHVLAKCRCGPDATIVISADGFVWAAGSNRFNRLAVKPHEDTCTTFSAVATDQAIIDVSIGDNHVGMLTAAHQCLTCGDNSHGQLGHKVVWTAAHFFSFKKKKKSLAVSHLLFCIMFVTFFGLGSILNALACID
eukprot:m.103959 g.103959  ORF g.103959 m.103959 type:complete len:159 (+) comp15060_c0_seq2:109-585(+)